MQTSASPLQAIQGPPISSASLARGDEPLLPLLIRLALPTVAVMFMVTALSVAETCFVSRLGTEAIAAASLVVPVILLMTLGRRRRRDPPNQRARKVLQRFSCLIRGVTRRVQPMNPQSFPFVLSAFLGLVVWAAVSRRYVWPRLRELPLREAAEPILYLHMFRFIGLAFIAPGTVGPDLPMAWAQPAAYGDLIAAGLAAIALLAGRGRVFRASLWIFSSWGLFDLLRAAVTGPIYDVPTHLHATHFIPVLGVTLLFWTHVMVVGMLLRKAPREQETKPVLAAA